MSATPLDTILKDINSTPNIRDWPYLCADARAELAQLRADLKAAQERIAWLTTDIGEDGLAAINRLVAACERGDIAQQAMPDLSIARDEILRQARQLEDARTLLTTLEWNDWDDRVDAWLAANPEPDTLKAQLDALAAHRDKICTCGMGGATMPEYHAKDCALYRLAAPDERIDRILDASGFEADEAAEV